MFTVRSSTRATSRLFKHRPGPLTAFRLLIACALAFAAVVTVGQHRAQASTNGLRGVNWADQRDNFVNGVLYPSGLSSSDTYSSASAVADRVVGQLYSLTGANTVRMPINEPTVANDWSAYTGAIDTALTKGNVILAYWAYNHTGRPTSMTAFNSMWDKVIAKYGSNSGAYFEPVNEPGYGATDLDNFYNNWLNRYSSVPRGRVILDGASGGKTATAVGNDSRLANTLISVHDYEFYESSPSTSESHWASQFASEVGRYASRTVMTEFGSPMSSHLDYSHSSSSNAFIAYLRGVTDELRTLGMGSVYWPGLRDGDGYSLATRSGSGSGITLSVVNASGLGRVQYGWGMTSGGGGGGGGTTGPIHAVGAGKCLDVPNSTQTNSTQLDIHDCTGASNQIFTYTATHQLTVYGAAKCVDAYAKGTTAGTKVDIYDCNGGTNQQWNLNTNGTITGTQSGLCLDVTGGSTANGTLVELWTCNGGTSQQWKLG